MNSAPNLGRTLLSHHNLEQGHSYVMVFSHNEGMQGNGFYEILEPVTDQQFTDIHTAFKRMGIEAYHVECTFRADSTFVLSNRFAPEAYRTLTFEIDAMGCARSIPKSDYQ